MDSPELQTSAAVATPIAPPRLRPGDTVCVVAPSGPLDPERIKPSLELLASRYTVRVDDSVFSRHGYLAGDDERRRDELNDAFRDPQVRGVFAARGGYGSMRILDSLDASALAGDPIPLVGFSDTTALLGWAWNRAKVRGIHGPVVRQFSQLPPEDIEWLFTLLENPAPAEAVLTGLSDGADARAAIEGRLWGGNLSLVANLFGSPNWPSPPADALVFLEEVGERPYAIDRYLTGLASRGAFRTAAAVIVGQLTRCLETSAPTSCSSASAVVGERFESLGIEVLRSEAFGHGSTNRALPFGARAVLASGELRLEEGAVS